VEGIPWRAEVRLTPNLVAGILKQQFPALNVRNVVFLHEGWDSFAFLADGEWVFLFPKRRERVRPLLASMRLLDELYGRVPLPVPHPQHWGIPGEVFPFHFAGCRFLPGSPADRVDMPQRSRGPNAQQLGEFLSALHRFPVDRVIALGVPEHQTRDHVEVLLDEVRHLADRLAPRLPTQLKDQCMPFLHGTVERPPPYDGQRCLTHGDLQAEHILLDDKGQLCGVIDFGDATISEPARDYAGLCAWQGWDFARAALGSSGAIGGRTTESRIIFMARCLGLIGLGWASRQDQGRMSVCQRFLRNAFGG
jgi:aminoglycoside phosphotransferase (APT) family kinase protein